MMETTGCPEIPTFQNKESLMIVRVVCEIKTQVLDVMYEGWNFNSGNYLFTTDTK